MTDIHIQLLGVILMGFVTTLLFAGSGLWNLWKMARRPLRKPEPKRRTFAEIAEQSRKRGKKQ